MSNRASSKQTPMRAAVLAALVVLFGACERSQAKQVAAEHPDSTAAGADEPKAFTLNETQRARIVLQTVSLSSYSPTLEATATVMFNGDQSTQVLAPISGPVARILVNPGARVRTGQLLATVASPDFAIAIAEYRKAEAATRNSERILKQNEALFKNDALSRRELEQSQTDASTASADLDAALESLRSLGVDSATIASVRDGQATGPIEAGIRSPLNGTVVEKLVSPGQLLQAGATPTFTVANLSSVWVMASVFESELALV
ncbi:MAG: efflux RND transporter periplasmic adaptor subunit, partial [Gemmatimonadaceae bacterium]